MEWHTSLLIWYLYLLVLGIIYFPVVFKLFGSFIDHGYGFAKTIAIIILSYSMFLAGTLRILPFSQESLILIIVISAFSVGKWCKAEIRAILSLPFKKWVLIGGVEILFFLGLLALTVIRGQEPSIHGLEKFMDFGFMQAIDRSTYFPPQDMWFSADDVQPEGYPINYYYFGHLTGAVLTKLTGLSPFVTYNLILATILGQGLTTIFSLTASIVHALRIQLQKTSKISLIPSTITGLLGTTIANLGGNLHAIYVFTKGYPNEEPVPFWKIFQTPSDITKTMSEQSTGLIESLVQNSSYWYPNATRFIPFTIHEFPSYSYVVADLHGHVFDIPFVVVTLGLIWSLYSVVQRKKYTSGSLIESLRLMIRKPFQLLRNIVQQKRDLNITLQERIHAILIGALIAVNYMTNAFDGPIYLLLSIIIFLFIYQFTQQFVIQVLTVIIAFVTVSLPFSLFFEPFASKIGVNCTPSFLSDLKSLGPFLFEQGNCQISEPYMLFILWGFFWISATLFATYITRQTGASKKFISTDWFIVLLFAFGTFLVIIPEFFYIKDIYPGHFRANTMFKLGYQAFIIMSIASAYVFFRLSQDTSRLRFLFRGIYVFCLAIVLIYPFLAFPNYYPGLNDGQFLKRSPQLDGSRWMESSLSQDKEIIEYIERNIPGQPVILEAQGDSYTDYNRISAYTGTPTVAGWWVHQWLWRGSSEVVGVRIPDIEALYQSADLEQTRSLFKKYQIEYVVISGLEREKYTTLNEEKFSQLGVKIYESANGFGALYKVY